MSLRAIQKRDRNKLSSAQKFTNRASVSVTAVAPPMTAADSMTARNSTTMSSSSSSSSLIARIRAGERWHSNRGGARSHPDVGGDHRHLIKRSSSYPNVVGGRKVKSLRACKSENDLSVAGTVVRDLANGAGGTGGYSSSNSFSTNNLYLGAKSEVCLKTLAVKNTLPYVRTAGGGGAGGGVATKRMYESRRTSDLGGGEFGTSKQDLHQRANASAVRIPIVGYEVMEERARFTIFKLRIENSISHTCWLVLRRYTDFVRLNNKLRTLYPHCNLVLPRKKWFGDNFSSGFIDNRIHGLQTFINTILGDDGMRCCLVVREFFCLDEPPAYSESMEESRIIFEAQEETIAHLKQQLQTKDELVLALQAKLANEMNRNKVLTGVIRKTYDNCAKCAKHLDHNLKEAAAYK